MKKLVFKSLKILLFFGLFCLISIFISNAIIEKNATEKVFSETKYMPANKVGLILGTAKELSNGRINLYYKYRLEAAIQLFNSGKIKFIVISGDNGSKSYDEPTDFKNDLLKAGIPENKIFLDYAGFRTLDSVVRIKEIFGQNSVTIISQRFHNERAIYLAEHYDIKAIGFNAKDVNGKSGIKVEIREYLARVKVFVDIIFNIKPKFLGDQIEIK
ncbi:protein SanA [Polaribacter reichenbachii]|uniref:Protein SanA n=1 Tax=Polaribacter reichenbachii TaxID=996801 RepID=A0A1B8U4S1_9FLAO|nr:ElyC/SanA/YdcF family protein [Polaribacter reichenbachii]APZ44878.1 protein SanA [Polaribacter reichenbachii]AUC18742.1 protein SanA [Polaribacter reichenbachii]OBY66856.1 protein SanA [Polaribacter reichenbachii]